MNNDLILASTSPRRAELLEKATIPFKIVKPAADEEGLSQLFEKTHPNISFADKVVELPKFLALRKAQSVSSQYPENLVLGADTIVATENIILGKPASLMDARQMISTLSGKAHQVITGIAVVRSQDQLALVEAVRTAVFVVLLSEKEIDRYIRDEYVLDAAGAYKIQGLFSRYIEKIDGSYTNIVGLPVEKVWEMIKAFASSHQSISM